MPGEQEHLTAEEVRRALNRLGEADVLRLHAIARTWGRKLRAGQEEDLLNEAIHRALDGRRRWPADLMAVAFLAGTMRSVASEWAHRDARELATGDDDASGHAVAPTQELRLELERAHARLVEALTGDKACLGILALRMAGTEAAEIRMLLGLGLQDYDTARRRLNRTIVALFPEGLDDE